WSQATGESARAVSLGERGTQVFVHFDPNFSTARLFSSFDAGLPTPVWSCPTYSPGTSTWVRGAASAETSDLHASITETLSSGFQSQSVDIRAWRSSSAQPAWTYTYPQLFSGNFGFGMSRDGALVVALTSKPGS